MSLSDKDYQFLKALLQRDPTIKQTDIFKKMQTKFGHAVAPTVIRGVRDELGIVAPSVAKKAAEEKGKSGTKKPGRPPKKAVPAPKRGGGPPKKAVPAPKRGGGRPKKAVTAPKKAAATPQKKPGRAKKAQAAPASLSAAAGTAPAPAPRRGKGRRHIDRQRVTFDHLPMFFVVAIDRDGTVHPFQTTSKALARERIDELINRGYHADEIGFYARSPYQVKATVSVSF